MSEIDLIKNLVSKTLTINYKSDTPSVFFDLCDDGGRVMHTGKLDSGKAEVCIKTLNSGMYSVYIVDGGELMERKFIINED